VATLAARRPALELERLDEAIAIFRDLGNPVGQARAEFERACRGRRDGEQADRGAAAGDGRAWIPVDAVTVRPIDTDETIVVQSLGRFRVLRGGA
jgi:hypothetical protein